MSIEGYLRPNVFADVEAFNIACDVPMRDTPGWIPDSELKLARDLIDEEVSETFAAIRDRDLIEVADGIADSIYVLIGLGLRLGLPLDAVWNEVQRSNMTKVVNGAVLRRSDGKIIKPEGFTPPAIAGVLEKASR